MRAIYLAIIIVNIIYVYNIGDVMCIWFSKLVKDSQIRKFPFVIQKYKNIAKTILAKSGNVINKNLFYDYMELNQGF